MSRRSTPFLSILLLLPLIAGLAGCDGSIRIDDDDPDPTSPNTVAVQFVYLAPTTIDPDVRNRFPGCVSRVGQTTIRPSWRNYQPFPLFVDTPQRWSVTFTDVPVGTENRIRINDPNACEFDENGASTEGVIAGNVRLTRVVNTPGNGPEPGLSFVVDRDGRVSP